MASDLFVFDASVHRHPNPDDIDLQYFADSSSIDILQAIFDDTYQKDPTHDQTAPPSHQMQSLSLTRFQPHPYSNPASDPDFFSAFDLSTEVENHHGSFESASNPTSDLFDYHRHICLEDSETMMQRNFSSHSFDDGPPGFLLQSRLDSLVAESGHMRRVCSTGDLQVGTGQGCRRFSSESSSAVEEATGFKVGRYSAEERKERIHRYRAKRSQRNFNKTIKYACRKTLADNRPRVRGRFARNDDAVETPKPTCSNPYEDEEDIWIEGFNAELEEYGTVLRGGHFFNSLGATPYQYYGFGH